jgi:hypothetical protein
MADKIVSWGGFDSKGTSGMGVTGSLSISSGSIAVSGPNSMSFSYTIDDTSPTFIKMTNGGNGVNTGGTIAFPYGTITGNFGGITLTNSGGSSYYLKLGISGDLSWTGANLNFQTSGNSSIGSSGISGTSMTFKSGGSFVFNSFLGGTRDIIKFSQAGNLQVGGFTDAARLEVKGSGATSSTTSFLVQNANASASLSVLDNSKVVIGTETVSQGSLYIGHNGTSGGSNGTSTLFFASQFGGNYPYRLGAEGNGYNFYLRQISGGQGSINIDFSGLNSISYNITNTNILNQSFSTSSIIVTKSTLNSYLAIGNTTSLSNSQTEGDTPLIFFRSMGGSYYDKTVDAAVTIRNGLPTAADDNITKNTAFWYRNGYIGIGTSTSLFATNTLQGALTINQGTNTGYVNRFPTTASLVNTSGLSTTVTFTPDNGNTAPSYNIIVGTIITANSASRKVTAVRYNNVTVDTAVDWSGGYPYTYRNPYVSIADGSRPIFDINPSGNVGIGISTPSSSLHISGASAVLTLTPQSPLPSGVPTGSFAVSSSVPPKPYFYDGTVWNALY